MQAQVRASMIVERRAFSSTAKVPLPDAVQAVLSAIRSDLRDIPRDCIVDRMELLHWLRRMAMRIDGAAAMTTAAGVRDHRTIERTRPRHTDIGRSLTSREVAEAVFGPVEPPSMPVERRTVTGCKGMPVLVEVRRRRHDVAAQFTMEV